MILQYCSHAHDFQWRLADHCRPCQALNLFRTPTPYNYSRCHSRTHAAELFSAMVLQVGTDNKAVPNKVAYTNPCPLVCHAEHMIVRALEARLLRHYAQFVRNAPGKSAAMGLNNLFIMQRVCDVCIIAVIDTAGARSGPHLPSQVFTVFTMLTIHGVHLLIPSAKPHVPPLRKLRREDESARRECGQMGGVRTLVRA